MTRRPDAIERAEIAELYADTMWALDVHDLNRYLEGFADEAVFEELRDDGTTSSLIGINAIRSDGEARFTGPLSHQHRMSNPLYFPLESGWTVWSYYSSSLRDAATGDVGLSTTGWIRDEIVRRDGRFLIRHRRVGQWDPRMGHPVDTEAGPT